jgi:hypothetical protein
LLSLHLLFFQVAGVASKPNKPEFVTLPTLQEQTAIQDAWTEQRISNIPKILNKYSVDAWLVCIICYCSTISSPLPDPPDQVVVRAVAYGHHPQTLCLRGAYHSNM